MICMVESVAQKVFPFDSFRENQHEITTAALRAFEDEGYKNVVIDGPVGTGKSAINTALLRHFSDGFYTTPSKSLREQLQNDDVLQNYLRSLKARRDYTCQVTYDDCEECRINQSNEESCAKQPDCTYWNAKQAAINHDIAVLTFSYLIVDGMIPEEGAEGQAVSFGDRETLTVDEAQNLVQQTASLHAGFKVSPYKLPDGVFGNVTNSVSFDANMYGDVKDEVNTILSRCIDYVGETLPADMSPEQRACKKLADKIKWMNEQVDEGYPWVVEVERVQYKGEYKKLLELQPINVGSFLKNFVWERANKRIISTATLPYRNKPDIWLRQVGLDPEETKVISAPMPFPVRNRPIHTGSMVASMSSGGDKENMGEIVDQLNKLSENHYNQNGLIHTSSYDRAERIVDAVDSDEHPYLDDNMIVHDRERDVDVVIEDWQQSDHDIMLSPAMYEGVDLEGQMCEWQVLAKVPYPSMDSRTEYMVENMDYGWTNYFERALIRVVQSYGRAIRSKTDEADYYVLDEDFDDLMKRRTAPEWFTEAINVAEPERRSLFDY